MIIVGAGGHAREVFSADRYDMTRFFAVEPAWYTPGVPLALYGKPVILLERALEEANEQFVIAIGDIPTRRRLAAEIIIAMRQKDPFLVVQHPSVSCDFETEIGTGTQILAQAVLGSRVKVGRHSLLNHGVILCHDARVGDFCNVGPGAILCGGAEVGDGCDIGCGARILPGVKVGDGAVVGAGAVVTENVPAWIDLPTPWVGVPARPRA